jgi:hypothetical protein
MPHVTLILRSSNVRSIFSPSTMHIATHTGLHVRYCTNQRNAVKRCARCPCRRLQVVSTGTLSATETTPLFHEQHGQHGDNIIDSIASREGPKQRLRTTILRRTLQPASTVLKTCFSFLPECCYALSAVGKRKAAVVQCTLNLQPCLQRRRFSLHVLVRQPFKVIKDEPHLLVRPA